MISYLFKEGNVRYANWKHFDTVNYTQLRGGAPNTDIEPRAMNNTGAALLVIDGDNIHSSGPVTSVQRL